MGGGLLPGVVGEPTCQPGLRLIELHCRRTTEEVIESTETSAPFDQPLNVLQPETWRPPPEHGQPAGVVVARSEPGRETREVADDGGRCHRAKDRSARTVQELCGRSPETPQT